MRSYPSSYTHLSDRLERRAIERAVVAESSRRIVASSLRALERWELARARWQVLEAEAETLQTKIIQLKKAKGIV